MKKIKFLFKVLLFIYSFGNINQAQDLNDELFHISKWGATSGGNTWPILNDSNTVAGNASIGETGGLQNGWATIRGGFDYDVEAASDSAIIIKGKLEFVGDGLNLDFIRFALIYQDSAALLNQFTDSAMWVSNKGHYGYGFMPKSGIILHYQPFPSTVWTIVDGEYWNSTAAYNGWSISNVLPAPPGVRFREGIYDWAISVQSLNDSTNEVRWYLIEENEKYWFGGTAIDTGQVTAKFNGICFGMDTGYDTSLTRFNLTEVRVEKGDPIAVPPSPWKHHYIDKWGLTPQGKAWPVLNDSLTISGNAGIGGPNPIPGWATIRGGFNEALQITKEKAVVVKGKIQFIGGGGGDTDFPFRYALTYNENDTLMYQYTDSAYWTDLKSWGCGFFPRTGKGRMPSGAGGIGTVWLIFNTNWLSTNSGSGLPGAIAQINQAPHNAELIEGTYEFAVSVHQLNDTINEIRWYLVEEYNRYWFGGIVFGSAIKDKFNAINFGLRTGGFTQFNIIDAEVDLGEPIDVPDAPWEPYYIDQWGLTPQGKYWPILNDSSTIVGDAGIGGENPINGAGWATIRGGFGQDLYLKSDEYLVISGEIEFIGNTGGGDTYTPFRYALTYHQEDTLKYQNSDSAYWTSLKSWGHGFFPRTGRGVMANGAGGFGTVWSTYNGNWLSTNNGSGPGAIAAVNQAPRNAELIPGTYEFAIAVRQINDTTNQIKWYLIEENNRYWFGGTVVAAAITDKFNAINFGVNTGGWTQVNIIAAKVDYGEVPNGGDDFRYYVSRWGFFGGKISGWTMSNNYVAGNVTISGDQPNTDWTVIRGEFDPVEINPGWPLKITGNVEFVGDGFYESGSFRIGLFYTENAGGLSADTTDPNNLYWTGTDGNASGYLFIPQSGSNGPVAWNGSTGTWGAVADTTWYAPAGYVLGSEVPNPSAGGAGEYQFEISVTLQGTGTSLIKFNMTKDNFIWVLSASDNHNPPVTSTFNSIAFALNAGNNITAVNLTDVKIDTGTITKVEKINDVLPNEYVLSQNYPNPFNPTTNFEFRISRQGRGGADFGLVTLKLYDLLGREVATIVEKELAPGEYRFPFSISHFPLSSGVYFYQLKAGNFMATKKFVLLK